MKSENLIVIYGSYGYTGSLIVEKCKREQLNVLLAGRNKTKLEAQSKKTGYPYKTLKISEPEKLIALLEPAILVIHCGGPFQFTAQRMIEACLATKTHYTDITGEIAVFELAASYNKKAMETDIMLLPGAGFDVVPTDCLALHLKNRLPEATHLELAFATSGGGSSRGTSKTAILGLGEGSLIRKSGRITKVPLHENLKVIDYVKFKTISARIPWGDVSTAYYSTGIQNIEVYMGVNKNIARMIQASRFLNWLLKQHWVKNIFLHKINKATGPDEEKRNKGRSYIVGVASDNRQKIKTQIETPNGYTLTALSTVAIAQKILDKNFKPGFQTPSLAYGADFILEFEGVTRSDL